MLVQGVRLLNHFNRVQRYVTFCRQLQQKRQFKSSTVVCMALKTGIVGLPNVGKSTTFNALVKNGKAQAANFPFCTIDPNVGIVSVPDERLDVLGKISVSQSIVPTSIEFVDIAGLVKGASQGEGLGNQFLANIRETDSIVQVVRCFEDENVIHVNGQLDPVEDVDVINFELILADVAQIERRMEKLKKGKARTKEEIAAAELEKGALDRINAALENNQPARSVELSDEEKETIKALNLLTIKPMTYAANVTEDDLADQGASNQYVQKLREVAQSQGCEVSIISAQVESELNGLDDDEAQEYLESLGVKKSSLVGLIGSTYKQLGLRTYFTSGEKETRAWTIRAGMTAPQAAGVIHTDFERGFIRAETVSYDQFVKCNGYNGAKENGVLRLEGKEYVVNEGDVMLFRFNV
eukprot:TRINITY_DN10367_c0_g4_i1.p1 TRINITY_DN10367_c0_g4~~TRINITY_DN10367_c0_g4_i1.p1  ORF type:complete len:437 (-),score=54.53 TRINITY_DN10367_c0_g4_i1:234-1463(-)